MVGPVWTGLEWHSHDVARRQVEARRAVDLQCIGSLGVRCLVGNQMVSAAVAESASYGITAKELLSIVVVVASWGKAWQY